MLNDQSPPPASPESENAQDAGQIICNEDRPENPGRTPTKGQCQAIRKWHLNYLNAEHIDKGWRYCITRSIKDLNYSHTKTPPNITMSKNLQTINRMEQHFWLTGKQPGDLFVENEHGNGSYRHVARIIFRNQV